MILLPFPLLRLAPSGNHGVLYIHVFSSFVQHVDHRLRVVLVDGEKEFSLLKPLVNAVTKTLSSASLIKKASLLKRLTYDLKLSSSHCLMFNKLAEDLLYLYLR